ncbi:VCBS repeat-containing protein [Zobellia roscoffensis]
MNFKVKYNSKGQYYSNCLLLISLFFLLINCRPKEKQSEGEILAKTLCATCHVFPEPSLLPSNIWLSQTLPEMGLRLGMSNHGPEYYEKGSSGEVYPDKPQLTQQEWEKLVMYYKLTAPQNIEIYEQPVLEENFIFETRTFSYDSVLSSIVTMLEYNPKTRELYLGDGKNSSLIQVDDNGQIIKKEKLKSPPVKVSFLKEKQSILTIGSLYPSDEKSGALKIGNVFINELRRPVDFLYNDINNDGFEDIVVCEFGNTVGSLVWYENKNNSSYQRHVIKELSGSIRIKFADIDNDGKEELLVLFTQERESLLAFSFEGNKFTSKKLLQFHPAFGVNDFETVDMNNDGYLDIVVSNGDNADYSEVLKNYHGVRVFLAQKNRNFLESYFYPFHGVSKIRVADFNLDGKKDVIAVSNFGNFKDENFRSITLLLGQGEGRYEPSSIANTPKIGWQTIDVADYDKDGDFDVFVGAFGIKLGPKESISANENKISWIRLKNLTND